MTTADAERHGPDAGYLLGSSLPMAVGWVGGTALAYALPVRPVGPVAVAAALLPLCFIATVLPVQWRGPKTAWPWCLSAGIALLAAKFVTPSWAMLLGGTAGTLWGVLRGHDV